MTDRDPPPADENAAAYRPISGWAIAGFGLALLSAIGIGLFAAVALFSGIPLQFDSTLGGLLLLALGGFGLSLVGWQQITRDENLHAGLGLARWGMMLSALFGLGYMSWGLAKELAVGQESRGVTDEWLDRLKHNKPGSLDGYVAFYQMLPPEGRPPRFPLHDPRFEKQLREQEGLSKELIDYVQTHHAYGASEQQRALYPIFCQHDLVQLLSQAGEQAKVEATGLRSWTYRGKTRGGFHVEQNYRITTAEGTFPAVVSVLSSDTPDGRLWQVLLGGTTLESTRDRRFTPLGQNALALRLDSREFARDWVRKLSQGMREEAFLDTLPAKQRPALRAAMQTGRMSLGASIALNGMAGGGAWTAAALADPESARSVLLPGFARFARGQMVVSEALLADPTVRPSVGKEVRRIFSPASSPAFSLPVIADNDSHTVSRWRISQDKDGNSEAVFWQPFTLGVPPDLFCEGMIRVASGEPAIVSALTPGAGPVNLSLPQRALRWRIVNVELTFGTIVVRDEK